MSWITEKAIKEKSQKAAALVAEAGEILKNSGDQIGAEDKARFDSKHAEAKAISEDIERLSLQANQERCFAAKQELEIPQKDMQRYSLHKAICQMADDKRLDGIEKEVNDEIAHKTGTRAKGFYFPSTLRNDTLTTGTGTIQTDVLAGDFIDLVRAKTLANQLGVQYISGLVGPCALPKQSVGSTAYWVDPSTGNAITISAATTTSVPLSASTCGAYTELPRSFLNQSSLNAELWTRTELATTVAVETDRVIFNGSGSGAEPEGLLQNSAISVVALGVSGDAPTYAKIVEMESVVGTNNFDSNTMAYVTTPAGKGKLKTTAKASGHPVYLWENGEVNGYRAFATNQVPSNLTKGYGTSLSAVLYGDFSQVVVGQWGAVDVIVNPWIKDTAGVVRVTCLTDMDVAIRNTGAFAKIADMVTT